MEVLNEINSLNDNTSSPCDDDNEGEYNLYLHIASIFILLITSLIGVIFPIIVKHMHWYKVDRVLHIGRFFGAGVITATGFVHIFPDAVTTLTHPCLPSFFSQEYTAAAGLFSLMSALLVQLIEYLAINLTHTRQFTGDTDPKGTEGHSHTLVLERKHRISTYILELAISIHSIIIGADLGITAGQAETLLIALIFHQFFEGIGLGYRIAEIKYASPVALVFNSLAYATTTPLGVAIGIGVHSASVSKSQTSLIFQGVMNALASGIMIYASLVTLIAEEFRSQKFLSLPRWERISCFVALYVGAGLMSLLGVWS